MVQRSVHTLDIYVHAYMDIIFSFLVTKFSNKIQIIFQRFYVKILAHFGKSSD